MDTKDAFATLLRHKGFRVTVGRTALLKVLQEADEPLTVEEVVKALKGELDLTNAYRSLEAFVKVGIVRQIDWGHGHAHYELAAGDHHHHVVCDSCGKVADIEIKETGLEQAALAAAPSFKKVRTHSLEFFGTCKTCA